MVCENDTRSDVASAPAGRVDLRSSEPDGARTASMAKSMPVDERHAYERLLYEQAALVEDRDRLAADHERLIAEHARVIVERDRLAGELRAIRGAKGQLPRTSGDLRAWRRDRGFNQSEAAKHLGVGRATVERAEARGADMPLGRALFRALERDAAAVAARAVSARATRGR